MAGNSVPLWSNFKGIPRKPPGVDITWITDNSASMGRYVKFIAKEEIFVQMEEALRRNGIGLNSDNRYSMCRAADRRDGQKGSETDYDAYLAKMEGEQFLLTVNGIKQRWATGLNYLNNQVQNAEFSGKELDKHENIGLGTNTVQNINRDYIDKNLRIVICASDEQHTSSSNTSMHKTHFTENDPYPGRYVGVMDVSFEFMSEPASPNPIPPGVLSGYVYTDENEGVAIYYDASVIHYRTQCRNSQFVAKAGDVRRPPYTWQPYIDQARVTNGAIYKISGDYEMMAESMGEVFGNYFYNSK